MSLGGLDDRGGSATAGEEGIGLPRTEGIQIVTGAAAERLRPKASTGSLTASTSRLGPGSWGNEGGFFPVPAFRAFFGMLPAPASAHRCSRLWNHPACRTIIGGRSAAGYDKQVRR